jgi:hypothetical protein
MSQQSSPKGSASEPPLPCERHATVMQRALTRLVTRDAVTWIRTLRDHTCVRGRLPLLVLRPDPRRTPLGTAHFLR